MDHTSAVCIDLICYDESIPDRESLPHESDHGFAEPGDRPPLPRQELTDSWTPVSLYIVEIRLPELLREAITPATVIDYGAGKNPVISHLASEVREHQLTARLIAYDPVNVPIRTAGLEVLTSLDSLREQGPVTAVLCNFSLHHADIQKELATNIRALAPKRLFVAEYDYTAATQANFLESFWSVAEQEELAGFIAQAGSEALGQRRCYEFHRQLSQSDVVDAIESAGFRPTELVTNRRWPYQYMIEAVRESDDESS